MVPDSIAMAEMPDDALVSIRQFVAGSTLSEHKCADDDSSVDNPTGQFVVVGPRTESVEGQPLFLSGSASVSPLAGLLLVGVVAWLLLRKG